MLGAADPFDGLCGTRFEQVTPAVGTDHGADEHGIRCGGRLAYSSVAGKDLHLLAPPAEVDRDPYCRRGHRLIRTFIRRIEFDLDLFGAQYHSPDPVRNIAFRACR